MKDIKKVDEILEYLHASNVRAVVAGGYVRDKVLKRESKDIDIFVLGNITLSDGSIADINTLLGQSMNMLQSKYEGDPDINKVFNSTTDDWQIDIIVRKENTIGEVLSHFPCSLSQACATYNKGEWEYALSNYFQEYMKHNLIYFTEGKSERAEYKERMINKFKDAVFLNKHDMTPLSMITVDL